MIVIMDQNSFELTSLVSLVSSLVMSPCSYTCFSFYGVANVKSELLVVNVRLYLVTMTCCGTMQSLRHGIMALRHGLRHVA